MDTVDTYISRFLNRFEFARGSWTDAVFSNTDINQLRNSDNTDTCINQNAEMLDQTGFTSLFKLTVLEFQGLKVND